MTDRISSFHTSPATTFYLESDPVETDAANNRTLVRNRLRNMSGPGATSGSVFGNAGVQIGAISGPNQPGFEFGRHAGHPFLPSGYGNGAIRWNDGPWDVWITHDGNGNATVGLQMILQYGSVNVAPSTTYGLSRIARAPGAPGAPSFSNILPTSVNVAWTGAYRGHADIDQYLLRLHTNPNPDAAGYVDHVNGASTFSRTLTNLVPGTRYYLKTYAHNADGYGPGSSVTTFETLAGGRAWDGSAWRNCRVRTWNGSAWQLVRVRTWNGSTWRNTR